MCCNFQLQLYINDAILKYGREINSLEAMSNVRQLGCAQSFRGSQEQTPGILLLASNGADPIPVCV